MSSPRPEVSVVMPVRDAADTIGAQLDALARQDFTGHWELVIALQRCRDDTRSVILSKSDTRTRIVDALDRMGAGYARNVGVEAARADLIAFCDADDLVADDWITQLMRHRDAPVVAGATVPFDGSIGPDTVDRSEPGLPGLEYGFLRGAWSNNMLVHRDAFMSVGGFDLHLHRAHDLDLAWRLQLAGFELVTAADAVVLYRRRPTTRGRWMQVFRWARYSPAFYRRFRRHGMPPTRWRSVARDWLWLVTRAPFVGNEARRELWLHRSAERVGRLVGSVLERTLYL